MNIMGLTDQEQSNILQTVAGILHLGNVMFTEKGNYSEIQDQSGEYLYIIRVVEIDTS
jgi:myosin-1